jgi:hypothetical protein
MGVELIISAAFKEYFSLPFLYPVNSLKDQIFGSFISSVFSILDKNFVAISD